MLKCKEEDMAWDYIQRGQTWAALQVRGDLRGEAVYTHE
jgi:hypothetical protein